jgi:hypothetical protein
VASRRVTDLASRDRSDPLFANRCGWTDAYVGALFGRDDAARIKLIERP